MYKDDVIELIHRVVDNNALCAYLCASPAQCMGIYTNQKYRIGASVGTETSIILRPVAAVRCIDTVNIESLACQLEIPGFVRSRADRIRYICDFGEVDDARVALTHALIDSILPIDTRVCNGVVEHRHATNAEWHSVYMQHIPVADQYYDLIELPSGGHIPVGILEDHYGVSWQTSMKIPMGYIRDQYMFTCPYCGTMSYYSGICNTCKERASDDEMCVYTMDRIRRKVAEHNEILRIIDEGRWNECWYIVG